MEKNEKVARGRRNVFSNVSKTMSKSYNTGVIHNEQERVSTVQLVTSGRN